MRALEMVEVDPNDELPIKEGQWMMVCRGIFTEGDSGQKVLTKNRTPVKIYHYPEFRFMADRSGAPHLVSVSAHCNYPLQTCHQRGCEMIAFEWPDGPGINWTEFEKTIKDGE